MSIRILGAVCVAALLVGCAKSSDPTEMSPNVASSRGYDAYNRGDYRDAAVFFETALAVDPGNAYALNGLAASRDSITYFGDSRPTSRDRKRDKALYEASVRGYDAYDRGDLSGAETQFSAILAADPGNAYARKGLNVVRQNAALLASAGQYAGTGVVPASTTYSAVTETRVLGADQPAFTSYDAGQPVVLGYDVQDQGMTDGDYLSVGAYETYQASSGGFGDTASIEQTFYDDASVNVDSSYGTVAGDVYSPYTAGEPITGAATVDVAEYGQGFGSTTAPALTVAPAYAGSDDGGLIYLDN